MCMGVSVEERHLLPRADLLVVLRKFLKLFEKTGDMGVVRHFEDCDPLDRHFDNSALLFGYRIFCRVRQVARVGPM